MYVYTYIYIYIYNYTLFFILYICFYCYSYPLVIKHNIAIENDAVEIVDFPIEQWSIFPQLCNKLLPI